MKHITMLFAIAAAMMLLSASVAVAQQGPPPRDGCRFEGGQTICETTNTVDLGTREVRTEPTSRPCNNPGGQPNWQEAGTTPILQAFQRTDTTTNVYAGNSNQLKDSSTEQGAEEAVGPEIRGDTVWSGQCRSPGGGGGPN